MKAPLPTAPPAGAKKRNTPAAARGAATLSEDARAAIRPGQSVALLQELHILTNDGRLNQDSRRKLKQVYHLYQFIEKLLLELPARTDADGAPDGLTVADHGAGKSYLGFILYDLFFKALGTGHIYGIETRAELVEKSQQLALALGFERMTFLNLSVLESTTSKSLPAQIDLVTALHACDTATDDAIAFGLAKRARAFALVPGRSGPPPGRQPRPDAGAHAPGRTLAPPAARARTRQPAHQRLALPVPRGHGLPSHRDRARGLGTQHEKRTYSGALHRPQKTRRRRASAGSVAGVRPGGPA